MTAPRVQLLGPPRLRQRGAWHPFTAEQRYRLLAYLAYRSEWIGRDRLAHLFWPDRPDAAARRNLRKLLYTVRALDLDDPPESSSDALRWRVDSDVSAFLEAVDSGAWADATEHWRGEPLQGLDGGSPLFDDWLQLERERLRDRWRHALLERARELEQAGDSHEAGRALLQLLEHDDLDEEALQGYLRIAAGSGERRRALQVYDAFASKLAAELDLEPTATSRALLADLRREDAPLRSPGSSTAPLRSADPPSPAAPLVGRSAELSQLGELLGNGGDGGVRLVTLLGPGGVGKSRLAVEALRRWRGGDTAGAATTVFVPLDAVTDPSAIAAAIADALGVPPGSDPLTQVARAIAGGRALLVLDTFEHLLAGAPALTQLLAACPGLQLIVTSRARLDLTGERLLPLAGLPLPAEDAPDTASEATDLFVERARRIDPDFAPERAPPGSVAAIARLVEGSPLALELAAAWVRALPLDAIAREIAANLDFLAHDLRDVAPRHRSLRATFEHSWALLTAEEQRVLRELSLFRGGFTLEAARRVTGTPLPVLAALVDKSLLRRDAAGRYDRHPLLYSFAREKLDEKPAERERIRERHARWFLQQLHEIATGGRSVAGPLARLEPELENIRSAWLAAVAPPRSDDLAGAAEGLQLLFETRARYGEGVELLDAAVAALDHDGDSGDSGDSGAGDRGGRRRALGRVLAARARLDLKLARYDASIPGAERALTVLDGLNDLRGAMNAHATLGAALLAPGDMAGALHHVQASLQLAERIGDRERMAALLHNLGVIRESLGDLAEARRLIERALVEQRAMGDAKGIVYSLNNLAYTVLEKGRGDLDYAERLLREGLELTERHGLRSMRPWFSNQLGLIAGERRDPGAARALCLDALEDARASGDRSVEAWVHGTLCQIALTNPADTPAGSEAWRHARSGLAIAWEIREIPRVLSLIGSLGELRLQQGRAAQGEELLALVRVHPASDQLDRKRAQLAASADGSGEGAPLAPADADAALAALVDAILAAPA